MYSHFLQTKLIGEGAYLTLLFYLFSEKRVCEVRTSGFGLFRSASLIDRLSTTVDSEYSIYSLQCLSRLCVNEVLTVPRG